MRGRGLGSLEDNTVEIAHRLDVEKKRMPVVRRGNITVEGGDRNPVSDTLDWQ